MMAKISVYYSEHEDLLTPRFLCIWFGRSGIDWDKTHVYIPVKCPFKMKLSEDFDTDVLSLSIAQTELIINQNKPEKIGIHIPTVQNRLNKTRTQSMPYDQNDIEQFIIQMGDIEEVFQMDVNSFYSWR